MPGALQPSPARSRPMDMPQEPTTTSSGWRVPHRADGVTVESGSIAPGTRFRRHAHEGVHLCCVVGGGFVEATAGGGTSAGAGTVRLSTSARHDIDFGPSGASCVLIHLDDSACALVGTLPPRPRFLADDWLHGLTVRLGVVAARRSLAADLEVGGLVVELLAQVARRQLGVSSGAPPEWLRRAREMLHDSASPSPSLVAAAVGVHRVHFARAFRDHYGEPVGRLVRRLRLQRALRLLEGGLPLAQVALEAGYADQSHLTREVSRNIGLSPARLRKRNGEPPPWPVS